MKKPCEMACMTILHLAGVISAPSVFQAGCPMPKEVPTRKRTIARVVKFTVAELHMLKAKMPTKPAKISCRRP